MATDGDAILEEFINQVTFHEGPGTVMTSSQIKAFCKAQNLPFPQKFISDIFKVGKGLYKIPGEVRPQETVPNVPVAEEENELPETIEIPEHVVQNENLVPSKMEGYVPFGFYEDLRSIINRKLFFPILITGMSGNGKTVMVEQTCAALHREMIRINISPETDTIDFLGGYSLVNGNTIHKEGPVITAMRGGYILLLDEVDRGSGKLLCLQGIMEGKPYYNNLTGEIIHPAPGFNIIATANTKGKGSEDGRYLAQILDDAFLERFPLTVEQEYPPKEAEEKIVKTELRRLHSRNNKFAELLVEWANKTRVIFKEGAISELITTRRLVFICQSYAIFHDKIKAIKYCISRFDESIQAAMLETYTMLDEQASVKEEGAKKVAAFGYTPEELPASGIKDDDLDKELISALNLRPTGNVLPQGKPSIVTYTADDIIDLTKMKELFEIDRKTFNDKS